MATGQTSFVFCLQVPDSLGSTGFHVLQHILTLQVLPLGFGLAMLGKVEVAMLIEDKTDLTWVHLVWRPQRGGGMQLILCYLNQQGTMRESQG